MAQASIAIVFALILALVGIGYVIWQLRKVLACEQGNEVMRRISSAIQDGAAAFMNREYRILSVFVANEYR